MYIRIVLFGNIRYTRKVNANERGYSMITLQNPSLDPFYNQAFEEVIFETVRDEDVFYVWRNLPAVVVGCYQNICREVRAESLRQQKIPVIRRMTGGGTVYHDLGNVNYTLILQDCSMANYERCLTPVIEALNAIGVPARKNRTCDIAIGDGKISGSAQRMVKGRLLHHGTLLFDSDLNVLDQITTHHKNEHIQTRGTLSDICQVTNVSQHLDEGMTIEQFMERLTRQMVPDGNIRQLTGEQQAKVIELRDEKYKSWEWTWGKTPNFTYEKDTLFDSVPIHICYQSRRGILSEAKIECEMIDDVQAAKLLNGARLDLEELEDICGTLVGERKHELLELII